MQELLPPSEEYYVFRITPYAKKPQRIKGIGMFDPGEYFRIRISFLIDHPISLSDIIDHGVEQLGILYYARRQSNMHRLR